MGTSFIIGWRSMGCSFFCQNCLLLLPQANSAAGEEQQEDDMVWHQVQAGFRPGHQPAKRLQQKAAWNWSQRWFHWWGFLRLRFRNGLLQCLPQADISSSVISAQRVPDTRPEPEVFFNTRSVPDLFSKSSGISGIGYFRILCF